ncbi:MAG TPA: TonB-dependent receptor [Bacteroidota bacterium]|nr:TonB-dependent receptor [Bacteroidota bacterium]
MNNCYGKILLLISCAVFISASAFAGNGKISGTVRDASTREPVLGINVTLVGTKLGGAVDSQGRYFILDVPPGEYALRAGGVGYAGKTIANVVVHADQTTQIDIALASESVQIGEVLVQAEQRVVDKSQTSSKATISKEELNGNLPTTTTIEVLNTTPGAYKGFIRGGRITETKTIVDGVDVTDQYYAVATEQTYGLLNNMGIVRNSSSQLNSQTEVNFGAVEQMSVNTGAAGAENSQATAGIINYSLKEGKGPIKGMISARSSQLNGLKYIGPNVYWNDNVYFAARDTIKAKMARGAATSADSTKLKKYTYYPGKYDSQNSPEILIDGNIGGDITENLGVYFSGQYFDSHGTMPSERMRTADLTLKVNYNLSSDFRLLAFAIVNDKGRFFGWKNNIYYDPLRFDLEGVPRTDGGNAIGSLKATHVLSPSTFYEVQISGQNNQQRLGFVDGNNDGRIDFNESGDFLTLEKTADAERYISVVGDQTKAFRIEDEAAQSALDAPVQTGNLQAYIARPRFAYENQSQSNLTAKVDFTSQVDFNNQIKAGFQVRRHDINKIGRYSLLGINTVDARLNRRLFVEDWDVKPTEMGVYVTDRMEYAGLVINLGARMDRWDPDASRYVNDFAPWLKTTGMIDDSSRTDFIPVRSNSKLSAQYFFSPRLGVSHPISDEAAMYFSYSRNTTPIPFSRLYTSYNTILGSAGSFNPMFLPTTDPTTSSNYELGVQWEFVPQKFGLTFTAYMRDIQNYSNQGVTLQYSGNATMNFAAQYADSRGVEISIQALRQSYFDFLTLQGRVNYAYSYVKASSWAGLDASQPTLFTPADSVKYNNQLPLADFTFYNKVQTNVVGGSSNLLNGFDREHRISYVLMLNFPEDVLLSSVGTFQSGFLYPLVFTITDTRVIGRQFASAPWNKQIDFHLEKGFTFAGLRAAVFADVKNAFNWTNIIAYDNSTTGAEVWERSMNGESKTISQGASSTTINGTPDPTGTQKRVISTDGTMFYDIPRTFYFGVKLDF